LECVDANAFFFDDLERRCRLDGDSGSHSVLGISLGGDPYRCEGSPAPHGRTPGGSWWGPNERDGTSEGMHLGFFFKLREEDADRFWHSLISRAENVWRNRQGSSLRSGTECSVGASRRRPL